MTGSAVDVPKTCIDATDQPGPVGPVGHTGDPSSAGAGRSDSESNGNSTQAGGRKTGSHRSSTRLPSGSTRQRRYRPSLSSTSTPPKAPYR
ncbi:hypothetical protein [Plantactinospora sp. KLBMP9567]|uniref:hypothetical protein n=1 Tax=Plantactinospora sp. KLBMP9567 TaxID=3085900 RepID=UPI00298265E6|nr:hypothetical protein [Plantactinospora sp. KLBMP9567]MDW5330081.1 hypothetical protein [Plantactinospora sp. KLBMP9567]